VPLGFFQGIFGVMAFFSHERITIDEELSNFLMSIGSQMGQFMAREIAEAERERIGKSSSSSSIPLPKASTAWTSPAPSPSSIAQPLAP
jgi:hypothetical protein